jgi:REP element-mobilizing transposase RayT
MRDPVAYHVILSTYGFWLPNDPRGSGSTEVRSPRLRPFGPATPTNHRHSVARKPHDPRLRRLAKKALKYPEVVFDGLQARAVARGFANATQKSGYRVYACSIMPCHAHLVIEQHRYAIDQVVRVLRQNATMQLLEEERHPFASLRNARGRLPSVWGQDFWKVFLYDEIDVLQCIDYVEQNPIKEGNKPQRWKFVIPFGGR